MQGMNIVGVQFRRAGKIYDFASGDIECQIGDQVVVDSERGPSLATVCTIRFHNPSQKLHKKLKPILRRAGYRETRSSSRLSEDQVNSFTKEKIQKLGLDMRILKSEIQFGGSKIVVFFSSPGRVDFRELVKELASGLKARVELKQVGARDETKLLGGIGICGREYCCSSFLREFVPVSIRMAKNQNLALNPNKVSGGCGRLLCCLTYENDVYQHLRSLLPPRGTKVRVVSTDDVARVVKSDLLNQMVVVEFDAGQQATVKVGDVEVLTRKPRRDGETTRAPEPPLGTDEQAMDEWAAGLDLDALEQLSTQSAAKKQGERRPRPSGEGSGRRPAQPSNAPGGERSGQPRGKKSYNKRFNNKKKKKSGPPPEKPPQKK